MRHSCQVHLISQVARGIPDHINETGLLRRGNGASESARASEAVGESPDHDSTVTVLILLKLPRSDKRLDLPGTLTNGSPRVGNLVHSD